MATRGLMGFRKRGIDKTMYNHYDSYPEGLGLDMLEFFRDVDLNELSVVYDKVKMVSQTVRATDEEAAEAYSQLGIADDGVRQWYNILRGVQGHPEEYMKGLRYMVDGHDFIEDSLFCEYGYIINLDTQKLEYWVGFQQKPSEGNRYGYGERNGYYPCKLALEFTQKDIVDGDIAAIVKQMTKAALSEN